MSIASNIENLLAGRLQRMNPLGALQEAIIANHAEIIDINQEQLAKGENAEGRDMGTYSEMWQSMKPTGPKPINLKDTGEYQSAMYLQVDNEKTEIRSRDWKERVLNEYVKRKSSGTPLGISKGNINRMAAVVKPQFVQKVNDNIQ
jgi:hypothetical protein